jgi:hypothetical protein
MTPTAFSLREDMLKDHRVTRPYPASLTFAQNPGKDRYVCASPSLKALKAWFGPYLELYQKQGGYIGVYEVGSRAIAEQDERQIVYQQRQAILVSREGRLVKQALLVEKLHPSKMGSK